MLNNTERRFNRLANEVRPRLIRQANLLTRNSENSLDLVQTALIKAHKNFDQFDADRGNFLNWTLRILQRVFLDDVRYRGRRAQEVSFEAMMENSVTSYDAFDVIDEQVDIEAELIAKEDLAHLVEMLNTLPKEYAEALRMAFLEGYSYEEVAEHQNTTVGTVRSRIHRAKGILAATAKNLQAVSA